MGFREGAFATVWEIAAERENFAKVRISTSRKDKKTDEYVTDFSGYVSLVGNAFKKLDEIVDVFGTKERCRIKLGACDVSNRYDREAGREYTNFTLFDFEFPEENGVSNERKAVRKSAEKKKANGDGKKKASPLLLEDEDDEGDGEFIPF